MVSSRSALARSAQLINLLMAALLAALSAFGCSEDHPGTRVANRRPVVVIKGGPLQGSTASYNAQIFWSGWDEDGAVDHYEYAVDPPPVFSQWEIGHPEAFPNIEVEVRIKDPRVGRDPGSDTLVVSKVVDGVTYSFRWVETHEFTRSFVFQTLHPDSQFVNGQIEPLNQYSGAHLIYVRCLDNEGAFSDTNPGTRGDSLEADYVGYTAISQTPTSQIVLPAARTDIAVLGNTLYAEWKGEDRDAPGRDKSPAGYLYNLVRLDRLEPPVSALYASPALLDRFGQWIYQSADIPKTVLELAVPGEYIFGVRAVDVAGAVEPVLQIGRNVLKLQALARGGKPTLCVSEPNIGTVCFRGIGDPQEFEVPAQRNLKFTWSGIPDSLVGSIQAYSWGLDLADLTVEGSESGWSGWSTLRAPPSPINFRESGTHILYVRVKDVAGTITLASLILHVIEFTLEPKVLLVDDFLDNVSPFDFEHDAFWEEMISEYAAGSDFSPEQFSTFNVFGANDRGNITPIIPFLSTLAAYELVIWNNAGWGYSADSGLFRSTAATPLLSAYLRAGGKLWITGSMTVAATAGHGVADVVYPYTMIPPGTTCPSYAVRCGTWAWEFLKLHSTLVNNDKGVNRVNLLHSARPLPQSPYDSLGVDVAKFNLYQQTYGGFSHADAVFDGIYAESEPGFRGDIDSLYVYGAAGQEFQNRFSSYHNKLCALRWHDPDPAREHGRVQWFGFEMYYFQNSQAAEVFKKSVDWMREEEPPTQ